MEMLVASSTNSYIFEILKLFLSLSVVPGLANSPNFSSSKNLPTL